MSVAQSHKVESSEAKAPARFNGIKVFSATMVAQREALGGVVTDWIQTNSHLEIVDVVVSQSSDASFHCIAITLFYWETVN